MQEEIKIVVHAGRKKKITYPPFYSFEQAVAEVWKIQQSGIFVSELEKNRTTYYPPHELGRIEITPYVPLDMLIPGGEEEKGFLAIGSAE